MDASIYGAKADDDTQLIVFDSSALKKQLLIFNRRIVAFGTSFGLGVIIGLSHHNKSQTFLRWGGAF